MKSKNILVVGGAGYIGSHMVKELLEAGHSPITLDNLSRGNQDLIPGGQFIKGDLSDSVFLNRVFSENKIDAVMHFAADAQVGESVEKPLKYYRNNIACTINLLETMVKKNVLKFIFSSTAAVYGEPINTPITEDHPFNPTNPYGRTKLTVEHMLHDCDIAHGLKSVCLRYFNAAGADASGVFGERHTPETHLIPLVLKVASKELKDIRIFGTDYSTQDGTCVRDYIHVTDLAQAHLLSMDALFAGEPSNYFNLGNSKGHSVKEVIQTAERVTGKPISYIETARRPGDPALLIADSNKIRTVLGWQPLYEDLDVIIDTAWKWEQKESQRKK